MTALSITLSHLPARIPPLDLAVHHVADAAGVCQLSGDILGNISVGMCRAAIECDQQFPAVGIVGDGVDHLGVDVLAPARHSAVSRLPLYRE